VQTNLITPGTPSFVVQGRNPLPEAAHEYLRLGIEHILLGLDHLLFVLGLVLIVRDRWLLFKTIFSGTR
jgi:hydrogenase/urease accessory protein HupE